MTTKELEAFREKLLKLERRCQGDVDTLQDEAFHNTDGMAVGNLSNNLTKDRAELASNNSSEETTIGLVENAVVLHAEIHDALRRIVEGTFGSCDECGHEISSKRLRAIPFVRQCISCARETQREDLPASTHL